MLCTKKNVCGALYNWFAVADQRNICPTGWHVPFDSEWTTLENLLGGSNFAGMKMKEVTLIHWANPNTGATNESGFTALPAGSRHWSYQNDFFTKGYYGPPQRTI